MRLVRMAAALALAWIAASSACGAEPYRLRIGWVVAGADLAKQARQYRPASISPGRVLFQHRFAARGTKFVELRIGALLLGGDARVAHEAAGKGGFPGFRWHLGILSSLEWRFYNSTGHP